jgi:hypothetical protein
MGAENLCHLAGCSAGRWLLGSRRLPGRGTIFGLWELKLIFLTVICAVSLLGLSRREW